MERKFGDFSEQFPTQIESDKTLEPLEDFCIEVSERRIFDIQISEIGQFLEIMRPYSRWVTSDSWNSSFVYIRSIIGMNHHDSKKEFITGSNGNSTTSQPPNFEDVIGVVLISS